MARFAIGEHDFLFDGAPYRVLSGAIHYFRVHPDLWADRIRKARLMGLNTIETYVAWNAHSPVRGEWDTSGGLDLGRFLDAVAAEGMHAIVRPGPYICAEWHNGGLPVWLTSMPEARLRSSEPTYLAEVTRVPAERLRDRGSPADRPGRQRSPRADRERVRRLRLRQGVPRRAGAPDARVRCHGSADHRRPAAAADAARRQPARAAHHRLLRRPGGGPSRHPPRASADGAA